MSFRGLFTFERSSMSGDDRNGTTTYHNVRLNRVIRVRDMMNDNIFIDLPAGTELDDIEIVTRTDNFMGTLETYQAIWFYLRRFDPDLQHLMWKLNLEDLAEPIYHLAPTRRYGRG